MKAIVLGAAAGLAFGMAASPAAHAQFAYPPLIELPPPQPYPAPQKPAPASAGQGGPAATRLVAARVEPLLPGPDEDLLIRAPPGLIRQRRGRAARCIAQAIAFNPFVRTRLSSFIAGHS